MQGSGEDGGGVMWLHVLASVHESDHRVRGWVERLQTLIASSPKGA
jgi:hypothetical protein